MLGQLLLPEIEELIEQRDFVGLRLALSELTVIEMSDLFEDLPPDDVAVIFRILPREQAARVFEYLSLEMQEVMLRALGHEQVAHVLNEMKPDDRTALLEELPSEAVQKLLDLLSPDERKVARDLLGYPEDSIGRRMTTDFVAIRATWTINQVMEHLRQIGKDKETLNILYVVDEQGILIDEILLRHVVLARPNQLVQDLMDGRFACLPARDDQEVAVREFKRYDRTSLPVVDSQNKLVGIITVDDILDLAEKEETEDVHKMAAVEALDSPYLDVGFWSMFRKRGAWLSALFLGEMLTASAMSYYEDAISKAVVLALFIPLIVSSGGNSGSQASTLVIRALALGELNLRIWWKVLYREIGTGLALGFLLGLLGVIRVHLWQWLGWANYSNHYHLVSMTVGLGLVGIVIFGTLVGSMLPFLFRILKLDPAVVSAPFVATLVDVSGLLIYFGIATVMLKGTLL
ncbi:MAG: Magnesium transporter MgtE [Phycisphaerae bacterium]|nr:Magnesium transporter MgtE [Phycisphaerae bacterium]